ncbi:hypothetical protein EYF80_020342 [Liparis tanakae]|uniref:Uncharacterized protein n=1 Tax=Liparis tanakae TaxID=230148 RepID=A0A4Z2HV19_9TELE|nr:hypothetical protein EYF80_020342 [Liparis tanakae]
MAENAEFSVLLIILRQPALTHSIFDGVLLSTLAILQYRCLPIGSQGSNLLPVTLKLLQMNVLLTINQALHIGIVRGHVFACIWIQNGDFGGDIGLFGPRLGMFLFLHVLQKLADFAVSLMDLVFFVQDLPLQALSTSGLNFRVLSVKFVLGDLFPQSIPLGFDGLVLLNTDNFFVHRLLTRLLPLQDLNLEYLLDNDTFFNRRSNTISSVLRRTCASSRTSLLKRSASFSTRGSGWYLMTSLLIVYVGVTGLQLLDLCPLAPDVRAVLLVALLQRAAQLLGGLQILAQLLHVILSLQHRLLLISGRVGAAQRGSQAAQHALLGAGQVTVQLVQLLREGFRFGVQRGRRHWG